MASGIAIVEPRDSQRLMGRQLCYGECIGGPSTVLPHASIRDIPTEVQASILARLGAIEHAHGVRIVLAVESGSRAWGFASPDSDFDVRFIYVRRVEDYVALFSPRDVIEMPLENDLDLNGWDLGKALKLGLAWNPALIEWLTSPIVYREIGWEAEAMRRLFARPLSRDALVRHYFGLASKQFARHVREREAVNLKKYFYVIRPAVALLWLERRPGETPPMSLPLLLDGVDLPSPVADAIVELRRQKSSTVEFGVGAPIAPLDQFCRERMTWAQTVLHRSPLRASAASQRAAAEVFHASIFGLPGPNERE